MSFAKDDEIKWLETELVPAILKNQKLIENFSETDVKDFQIHDIDIQLIGTEEAFMLTTCYKAQIKYEFKGSKQQVNLFVKKTPQLPQEIYDSINFNALFNNEILAYEKIMPAIEEFGKINLKLAKYYYGKLEKNSAIVVTEDFSCDGWTVAKDMVNISLEHILLGVEYLAQFHAVGFAMRQQKPQLFEELTKELKEPRYASDLHTDWAITLKQSIQRVAKATREYEKSVDKKFIEDFVQLLGDNHSYAQEAGTT
ncbi:hypothetical protein DOY81_009973 [Sarcophaga bullata]|nr:hypothetical protein DOY81_009973 [Sarcophaga bullata]